MRRAAGRTMVRQRRTEIAACGYEGMSRQANP
jgi:hypothetical protein